MVFISSASDNKPEDDGGVSLTPRSELRLNQGRKPFQLALSCLPPSLYQYFPNCNDFPAQFLFPRSRWSLKLNLAQLAMMMMVMMMIQQMS
jgi:hypothetical protein